MSHQPKKYVPFAVTMITVIFPVTRTQHDQVLYMHYCDVPGMLMNSCEYLQALSTIDKAHIDTANLSKQTFTHAFSSATATIKGM